MGVKIARLEAENVKRIKAVKIEFNEKGLTLIGGNNRQGKSSVLDAIAWALGGEKRRPSKAGRQGAIAPPQLRVVLDNGFIVERKGKNASLKVTDPTGNKSGQQILNEFIEQLALDLPKFMRANEKEKAETLLKILGIGEELARLESREADLFNERTAIGRIADRKEKYVQEMIYYEDAPKDLTSAAELIKRQQEILAKNGENQKKRDCLAQLLDRKSAMETEIERLEEELKEKLEALGEVKLDIETAEKSAEGLEDEPTAQLEESIANIEETNRKVRANLDREKAEDEAKEYRAQYDGLTAQIEKIRAERDGLLKSADLPLPELSVQDGKLVYKGQRWDCMAGSEQLIVATAIVQKLNPDCGFVLLDKLEQMDLGTLEEFGEWLEAEGLQAIATRVSTGDECSVIIEDGCVAEEKGQDASEPKRSAFVPKQWEEGGF